MNPKVEAFYNDAPKWREELGALRAILRDNPLCEDFKWRSPCYTFEGGNVATVWRLKDCCALAFFKGTLLKNAEGILAAPGENSRAMRVVKFTSVPQIAERTAVLKGYVEEAIEVEKAGLKVVFSNADLTFPAEFLDRLAQDPALQAAFAALTPGRQRGYSLYFSQPKQSKTRAARIDKCAPRILDGKGLHDR